MVMAGNTPKSSSNHQGTGRIVRNLSNQRQQSGNPKGNEKAREARSRPLSDSNQKRSGSFDPNTEMSANERARIGVLKALRNAMQDRGLLDLDTQIAADNIAQKTLRAQAMANRNHNPNVGGNPSINSLTGSREGVLPGGEYGLISNTVDNVPESPLELAAREPTSGNYSMYTAIDNALNDAGFDALDWEPLRGRNSRNNKYQRSVVIPQANIPQQDARAYYEAIQRGLERYPGNGIMRMMPDGSIELVDDPRVRSDSFMHSTKGNIMMSIRDAMKRQGLL